MSPKRKPALMGLLRDQQRDTLPGRGAAFSLGLWNQGLVQGWRLFSQLHCQEWRSSDSAGKAVLHVCRWQEEGLRDDRDSHSQVPARHCPGGGGRCRQAEWASWSCDHSHVSTAGVCPCILFFFFWWKEKRKGLCPCLWIGCGQSRCSVYSLRGFCRRTHVLQDGFTLPWSDPL